MLIESAFTYLPEILTGSNFEVQNYEAGITNAISLAVLQELNARNIANPLGAIVVEKVYSSEGYAHPNAGNPPRYDRADLFLNLASMYVATKPLSRFGWRHRNYVEAKYFRPSVMNPTNNSADLLADLIRLCALVKPQVHGWEQYFKRLTAENKKEHRKSKPLIQNRHVPYEGERSPDHKYPNLCIGRYLLHVYKGDPNEYLGKMIKRDWAQSLIKDGRQEIVLVVKYKDFKLTKKEKAGYVKRVADALADLKLKLTVTNRVVQQEKPNATDSYRCVLTRIDAFEIAINGLSWKETVDRVGEEGGDDHWKNINALVGTNLSYVPKAANTKKGKKSKAKPDGLEPEAPPPTEQELESISALYETWEQEERDFEEALNHSREANQSGDE